VLHVVVETAFA